MTQDFFTAVAVVVLAFLLLVLPYALAYGHEAPSGWSYPATCCSGRDCGELPREAVREGPDGYEVTILPGQHQFVTDFPLRFTMPYQDKKVRVSPDGEYHVCLNTELTPLCFFAGARAY